MQLTHLGPYKIERPLGKGGMGAVYVASDPQTGQPVAIKALSPHLAMAEGFRERFEAEIESLKTLRHEGIVRLYGYGEQDGILFYSMELVNGTSLEDELRAGRRFNWREVTNIAIQLSLALKHAHDHGIVHRDIKPANILLDGEDRVKLADFGIARLFGMTQLTTAGGVLGTADYMSPEQAEGRPVTARCDQYSLGGVMYALLAGRPPFTANNLPQMLQLQRFAEPEPVRRYAPDTPEQLEQLIGQLLSKDPANRFPNTQVLARHLQAMVRALSRPAADDFALANDPGGPISPALNRNGVDPNADSLAMEPTQLEVPPTQRPSSGATTPRPVPTHDAPTLAAGDIEPGQVEPAPSSAGGSVAKRAVSRRLEKFETPAVERTSRFTTVEEDEAKRRAEQHRPWPLLAIQLAALVGVIACIVGGALYLSRPATADDLYRTISEHVEQENGRKLEDVANEVDQFLTMYPDDSRAGELERYKELIELNKLERKLQRHEGGTIDPSLLPVERLYLQALSKANPESALATLQSLVDLYGPTVTNDEDGRAAAIVQLSKRRIASLKKDLAKQQEQHLASLRERLKAANELAADKPTDAAAMYRALITLHESDAWAAEIVAEARQQLTEVENAKP